MKKFFSKNFFGLVLMASTLPVSCTSFFDGGFEFEPVSTADADQENSPRNITINTNDGAYSDDIFNLTHDVDAHWTFYVNHDLNQNGGFVLKQSNEQNKVLAETSVIGSKHFEKIKTLIFSIKGSEGDKLSISLVELSGKETKKEIVLNADEDSFELFIGACDLSNIFKVKISSIEGTSGEVIVRDIHFSANLPENDVSPYIDEGSVEIFATRDYLKHWEFNHDIVQKYDDVIYIHAKESDPSSAFAKTTIKGSEKLKRFKTIQIKISTFDSSFGFTSRFVVAGKEKIFNPRDAYNASQTFNFSLENVNVEDDIDIYVYPRDNENVGEVKLTISSIVLTPFESSTYDLNPYSDTFNATSNSFYHWKLANDVNEKITFNDDVISTETYSDTNNNLRMYTTFEDFNANDFTKVTFKVKGPSGNIIKVDPINSSGSYNNTNTREFTLNGEEQEFVINLNRIGDTGYRSGVCVFPMYGTDNIPGKFEIISINYELEDDVFRLESIKDKLGGSEVDITSDIKDYWKHSDNVTIDENGQLDIDFSDNTKQGLDILFKRSEYLSEYNILKLVVKASEGFNVIGAKEIQTGTMNEGQTSLSGLGYIEPIYVTLYSDNNFATSNKYLNFYKWNSTSANACGTLKIMSVSLLKNFASGDISGDSYLNLATNMGTKWRNSVLVEDTNDGSIMTLPSSEDYYYNYAAYKFYPNSPKTLTSLDFTFDAPSSDIIIKPIVALYSADEVTITPSMTSVSIPLTRTGNVWTQYAFYKIGFAIKNTTNNNLDFKVKKITFTAA